MRKAIVASFVVALGLFGATPASADPARESSASAFGIAAPTGLLQGLIPPQPTVSVKAPPDSNVEKKSTLDVPLGTIVRAGVITVHGVARTPDDVGPRLTGDQPNNNARGYAAVDNLDILIQTEAQEIAGIEPISLLKVDLVEAEALARCVSNIPQFDTGANVSQVRLGETDVGLLTSPGGILDTVVDLFNPQTGGVLSTAVSIQRNEVIPMADGVAVNALRIKIPLLNVDLVVSHAEVHMPTPCGVAPPATEAPPASILAQTGGSPMTSEIGLTLLAVAALALVVRRGQLAVVRRRVP